MNRIPLFFAVALTAVSADAAIIQLNFGPPQSSTLNPAGFNFITNGVAEPVVLLDSAGAATGLSLQQNFTIGADSNTKLAGIWPLDAEKTYLRTDNDNGPVTLTFTGLDPALTYDFTVFGSTSIVATGRTDYTLTADTGGSVQTITWPSGNPKSVYFQHTWNVTDADGQVTLTVDASMNIGNSQRLGTLNVIEIAYTPVPEPALAAVALGGAAWLLARRRRAV